MELAQLPLYERAPSGIVLHATPLAKTFRGHSTEIRLDCQLYKLLSLKMTEF